LAISSPAARVSGVSQGAFDDPAGAVDGKEANGTADAKLPTAGGGAAGEGGEDGVELTVWAKRDGWAKMAGTVACGGISMSTLPSWAIVTRTVCERMTGKVAGPEEEGPDEAELLDGAIGARTAGRVPALGAWVFKRVDN